MEIPIYIDGERTGALTITRQGCLTVMDARLRDEGRVVRLKVFGERTAYLGVPAPQDGELRLVRRLTPAQMRAFPRRPAYAGEKPREETAPPEEAPARKRVLWQGGKPYYF